MSDSDTKNKRNIKPNDQYISKSHQNEVCAYKWLYTAHTHAYIPITSKSLLFDPPFPQKSTTEEPFIKWKALHYKPIATYRAELINHRCSARVKKHVYIRTQSVTYPSSIIQRRRAARKLILPPRWRIDIARIHFTYHFHYERRQGQNILHLSPLEFSGTSRWESWR